MLYQIYFFAPEDCVEPIKAKMFEAGAGKVGDYEMCAWQTLGMGQFKPLTTANPHIGKAEQLSVLKEYRVEMVCDATLLKRVLTAMIAAHPYEEVAYGAIQITTLDDLN